MKCRKSNILIFLFLIHFLFYAVSPICYADDQLSEGGMIICRPGVGIKNGFFTWELIFSKFIYHNASSGSLPTIQFIIKKARAILESNDITKIFHGNSLLKIKLFTVFIVQLLLTFIQIPIYPMWIFIRSSPVSHLLLGSFSIFIHIGLIFPSS